jgi:hypothetical protein
MAMALVMGWDAEQAQVLSGDMWAGAALSAAVVTLTLTPAASRAPAGRQRITHYGG